MRVFRKVGKYISIVLLNTAHEVRSFLHRVSGKKILGVRIILIQERHTLLVSHWYAPFVWTLPGGGVKKTETPEQAAIREVSEETGFKVHSLGGLIGTYRGRFNKNETVYVYYTGDFDGSLSLTPNIEIMARSWFDIDNLPDEISPGNQKRIDAYRAGVRDEKGIW